MKRSPILVCGDAGVAGRVLLARRDFDTRWALTAREARAALESRFPMLVIASEDLAPGVLEIVRGMTDAPPCIVLLEADGWERREAYFGSGATALVRASSGERILEAISELTGVRFAACPRVAHETIVEVVVGDENYFAETIDISASGVAIGGIQCAELGLGVEMTFSMIDPPFTAKGIIVRVAGDGSGVAGIAFTEIDPLDRVRLAELVDAERAITADAAPEPIGLTVDLAGPMTMDVSEAVDSDERAAQIYRSMLAELVTKSSAAAPTWLGRVRDALTEVEREALARPDARGWLCEAIEHRIILRRSRNDMGDDLVREREIQRVLELCCSMAEESELETDQVAFAVTKIRADLLREIYGASARKRIGAKRPAEKPAKKKGRAIGRAKLDKRRAIPAQSS